MPRRARPDETAGDLTRDAVLRIEFGRAVGERAVATTVGLEIPVGYRLHVLRNGLVTP